MMNKHSLFLPRSNIEKVIEVCFKETELVLEWKIGISS